MAQETQVMLEAARLYYQEKLTQDEIAKKLFLSRSKISRLLKQAEEEHYVTFTINGSAGHNSFLERQLKERFSLTHVCVVESSAAREDMICHLAEAAAQYLSLILSPESTIAIARGKTLQAIVQHMPHRPIPSLRIAQIIGSLGDSPAAIENELNFIRTFAAVFDAAAYNLYSPLALSNQEEKEMFLALPYIKQTLQLAREAEVLLLSLGEPYSSDSLLHSFLTREELNTIPSYDPAGTFCGYFYNIKGQFVDTPWNQRMVGLPYPDLMQKKHGIALVYGGGKVLPALGALRGHLVNTIFTDEETALEILIQDRLR